MSFSRTLPTWRFAYLLSTLLLLIAFHPFFVGNIWEPLLLNFFFSLVIIASVFAVSRSTMRMLALILALPVLSGRWLIHFFPFELLKLITLVSGVIFVAFVVVRILQHVLRQTTVTSDTIFAALSVYLLFGLGWGMMYMLVEHLIPGSFAFPAAELSTDLLRELFYFSLVTLTTLGYGDVTPVTPVAQGFSNLEAVLGQIYLASLVARLVGIQVAQSVKSNGPD